jgi:hypothetical protein
MTARHKLFRTNIMLKQPLIFGDVCHLFLKIFMIVFCSSSRNANDRHLVTRQLKVAHKKHQEKKM